MPRRGGGGRLPVLAPPALVACAPAIVTALAPQALAASVPAIARAAHTEALAPPVLAASSPAIVSTKAERHAVSADFAHPLIS